MTAIKNVDDKKNTILLLDAFDEDIHADKNHKLRIREILDCGKDFCVILITCRTQFFPSEEELPTEATYIKTYGDDQTEYKFQKLYLSVFDDKDINKYLEKKFPLFPRFWSQFKRRINANKIISKSPNLVMRQTQFQKPKHFCRLQ